VFECVFFFIFLKSTFNEILLFKSVFICLSLFMKERSVLLHLNEFQLLDQVLCPLTGLPTK
jgi:hypothetical protein